MVANNVILPYARRCLYYSYFTVQRVMSGRRVLKLRSIYYAKMIEMVMSLATVDALQHKKEDRLPPCGEFKFVEHE